MLEPSAPLIEQLKSRYAEPQRHYHTWAHIDALRGHFDSVKDQFHDPTGVLWALYWHDAIYDPQAADNEQRSADLLLEEAPPEVGESRLKFAACIIRATQKHEIPSSLSVQDESDLALFLDIDLSILAANELVFDQYEAQIRAEYEFVPLDLYRQARAGILKGFLNRARLYFSDHYYNLWETRARDNLQRSITRLDRKDYANV
jgi:predicted metal-dependent HD superfamily phosphohydrolase